MGRILHLASRISHLVHKTNMLEDGGQRSLGAPRRLEKLELGSLKLCCYSDVSLHEVIFQLFRSCLFLA